MDKLHIIVGLGNPGRRYENTKHNIGFIALDQLAERNGIKVNKLKFKALTGEGEIAGARALLIKPQTYMNLSGESVLAAMSYYKAPPERLTVIYDDIDIPMGSVRIRKKGSAGTHNGMRSVISHLQCEDFPRIRIGIGGERGGRLTDYVIGGFGRKDLQPMREAVLRAVDAMECILKENIDLAMNRYNARPEGKPGGAGGDGPGTGGNG
jgi:PTH1 family peptidyl-tRNA hydrolase